MPKLGNLQRSALTSHEDWRNHFGNTQKFGRGVPLISRSDLLTDVLLIQTKLCCSQSAKMSGSVENAMSTFEIRVMSCRNVLEPEQMGAVPDP